MKNTQIDLYLSILLLLVIVTSMSCTFEVIKPLPTTEVILKSFHGRYVTAMGEDDNWALRQETELVDCGRFVQHNLANGRIALKTCYGRYITAPEDGAERQSWMLGQESRLGDCAQFELYSLGSDRVALKTCAGRFLTAGDGNWPGKLAWSIIGETHDMEAWEIFTRVAQP